MKSQKPTAIIAARELVSSASSVKILFFFASDFFFAFSLDRKKHTQPGPGCGANVGGVWGGAIVRCLCCNLLSLL